MTRRTLPKVGDRVVVPWGASEVEGKVVHVSRTLKPASISVEVWLEGGEDPMMVTYPADRIRPAEPVTQ